MWKGVVLVLIGILWIIFSKWSDKDLGIDNNEELDKGGFNMKNRGLVYASLMILMGIYLIYRVYSK